MNAAVRALAKLSSLGVQLHVALFAVVAIEVHERRAFPSRKKLTRPGVFVAALSVVATFRLAINAFDGRLSVRLEANLPMTVSLVTEDPAKFPEGAWTAVIEQVIGELTTRTPLKIEHPVVNVE